MKYLLVAVLVLNAIFWLPSAVQAEDARGTDEIIDAQLAELELEEISAFLEQLDQDTSKHLPTLKFSSLLASIREGKLPLNLKDILAGITRFFCHEVVQNSSLLGKLVILAVICAVLYNLQTGFGEGGVGQLAHGVCYLVLLTIAAASFTTALAVGRETIDRMVLLMQALLPVLLTLLTAVGGPTSAAVFHPVLVAAVSIMATVVKNIVFPLLFFGAILAIVSHISERFRVTRLAGLCRDIGIGVLGLSLTVMIGVIAVQGIAGSVADGVALRTAKYMTGAFLPVVGGVLSDAVEAVVGCSLLLKDAIGLLGALAIFVICIFPVLKIAAMTLIYKIASALIQPIGDVGLADSLQTIASYLMLVLASVASVGVMLFLMIAAVVGAGSLTVMLR